MDVIEARYLTEADVELNADVVDDRIKAVVDSNYDIVAGAEYYGGYYNHLKSLGLTLVDKNVLFRALFHYKSIHRFHLLPRSYYFRQLKGLSVGRDEESLNEVQCFQLRLSYLVAAGFDVFACDDLNFPIEKIAADITDTGMAFRHCGHAYVWSMWMSRRMPCDSIYS